MKSIQLRDPSIPASVSDATVLAAMRAIAMQWPGMGPVGGGERLAAYAALLYPHDEPNAGRYMALRQSSCALTAMALLRALGAAHPALDKPYAAQVGQAVANITRIARDLGAWVDCTRPGAEPPTAGCIVLLGGVNGQMEHVVSVVDNQPDDTGRDVMISVEGGQADDGIKGAIQRGARVWIRQAPAVLVAASYVAGKVPRPGRRVAGYVDVTGLRLERLATVPDDFVVATLASCPITAPFPEPFLCPRALLAPALAWLSPTSRLRSVAATSRSMALPPAPRQGRCTRCCSLP